MTLLYAPVPTIATSDPRSLSIQKISISASTDPTFILPLNLKFLIFQYNKKNKIQICACKPNNSVHNAQKIALWQQFLSGVGLLGGRAYFAVFYEYKGYKGYLFDKLRSLILFLCLFSGSFLLISNFFGSLLRRWGQSCSTTSLGALTDSTDDT